jgi:hypothetical protein
MLENPPRENIPMLSGGSQQTGKRYFTKMP